MNLVVSSQWDDEFLYMCQEYGVKEVYGSFRTGGIGSARPAVVLPEVTFEQAEKHVQLTHELGMKFNYVVNAPCLGNMEFDVEGRKEIYEYFKKIDALGVDSVTLAVPFLVEMVKREFPRLKIKISEIANVGTAQRAQYYEKLGADILTLEIAVNRDFKVLKSIRKAVSPNMELEVVVNAACLYQCPFHEYHNNMVSHTGQECHKLHGFYMDYCMMRCIPTNLTRPGEIMKARWIRPEDVKYYEEIGINRFKISNRVGPMKLGKKCLKAYAERKCDDIGALLTPLSLNIDRPNVERLIGFTEEEWERVVKIWDIRPPHITIDNHKLEHFLEYFKSGKCYGQCGNGGCNYCEKIAEQVVSVDEEEAKDYAELVEKLIDPLLHLEPGIQNDAKESAELWTKETEQIYEQLCSAIPEIFRETACAVIRRKAEQIVRERNIETVTKDVLEAAFITETPEVFKSEMIDKLMSLNITKAEKEE